MKVAFLPMYLDLQMDGIVCFLTVFWIPDKDPCKILSII